MDTDFIERSAENQFDFIGGRLNAVARQYGTGAEIILRIFCADKPAGAHTSDAGAPIRLQRNREVGLEPGRGP
jgi:hypothetical protein